MHSPVSSRLAALLGFIASSLLVSCGGSEDGAIDEKALKNDICLAAAMDKDVFAKILESGSGDLSGLEADMNLTAHWLFATSVKPEPGAVADITTPTTTAADPSDLVSAVTGGKRVPTYVSVVRPEYITGLEASAEGEQIQGSVTFKATNGIYQGTVEFSGVPDEDAQSGWMITGFHLPKEELQLTRENNDSPWKRSPAPASE